MGSRRIPTTSGRRVFAKGQTARPWRDDLSLEPRVHKKLPRVTECSCVRHIQPHSLVSTSVQRPPVQASMAIPEDTHASLSWRGTALSLALDLASTLLFTRPRDQITEPTVWLEVLRTSLQVCSPEVPSSHTYLKCNLHRPMVQ